MTEALDSEIRTLRAHFWSERDPEGRAFAPLADAYLRKGDLDEARALLDDGLGRLPDFASGHLIAARVHRARGDGESLRASVGRLRELDPDNAAGLRMHGEFLEEEGRLQEALDAFRRALELNPDYDDLEGRVSRLEVKVAGDDPAETGRGVEGIVTGAEVYTGTLTGDDDAGERASTEETGVPEGEGSEAEVEDPFDSLTPWAEPGEPDPLDVDFQDLEGVEDPEAGPTDDFGFGPGDFDGLEPGTPEVSPEEEFELDSGWDDPDPLDPPESEPEGEPDPDPAPTTDESSPTVTRTLGELYLRQGLTGRAVEVFEELVRRNPGDEALRARLDVIRGVEETEGPDPGTDTAPPPELEPSLDPEDAPDDLPERSTAWAEEVDGEPMESLQTPFAWDGGEEDGEDDPAETDVGTTTLPTRSIGRYLNDLRAWVPGAVPVESLDPSAVPIESLAPREEGLESLQEGEVPELDPDDAAGDGDLDDFQEWLRGLRS